MELDLDGPRLRAKRDWLSRQHEREMRRRPHVRLPDDHPLFDAEDLPHWWQRWFAEGVGVVCLLAVLGAVAWASSFIPPISPYLDRLAVWIG